MTGTVVRIRRRGVEAEMQSLPALQARFDIYRVVNGQDVPVGSGFVHRLQGAKVRINSIEGSSLASALVGDLVRPAP